MNFEWNDSGTADFALKLAAWFVWALAESGLDAVRQLLGDDLPVSNGIAIAAGVTVILAAFWLVMKLIKLLLMGSIAATVGLVALHLIQR